MEINVIRGLAILVGLCVAGIAQFFSFLMAGAGHGWVAPMFYSPALFIAYPIVLVRLLAKNGTSIVIDLLLLAVAITLDIRLATGTYAHELQYFLRYLDGLTYIWILLWILWQVLIVVTIMNRIRRRVAVRPAIAEET